MRKYFVLVLFVLTVVILGACTSSAEGIEIDAAWIRPAAAEGNTAAYMQITNNGRTDVTLIRVESDLAPMVQIHQTTVENDIASMQHLENGLIILAGETAMLEPGGLHVMFMNLPNAIEEDGRGSITLVFDDGTEIVVDAPVRTEAPDS